MNANRRWKTSFKHHVPGLGLALALALGIWAPQAAALTLGRVIVLSALGQPLHAEIEVLDINNEEAATLAPKPAAPDAYRTSGLEYSRVLDDLQVSLQRRANGQRFLLLRNTRAINEPYVDLIIEATWSSGRLVRDYTMLFDPPGQSPMRPTAPMQLAQSSPVAPPVPAAAASVQPVQPVPAPMPAPAATPAPAKPAAPTQPAAAAAPTAAARATPSRSAAVPPPADKSTRPAAPPGQLNVIWGDTASEIALAAKPANVSLDQMLIALLQANPQAFVNNNVNRLRAGAVLTLPSGIQAEAVPRDEARRMVVAQSRDFDEYRRRLAGLAPTSRQAASGRESGGSVQTRVEDRAATARPADQLTLAKPSGPAAASADQLAAERNAQEAASRSEALAKSIEALQRLNQAATSGPAADRTPIPVGDASAPQPESKPLPGLDVPAGAPVTPPAAPTAADKARDWIERLSSGPWLAAAGAVLIALAIAVMLNRRGRKDGEVAAPEEGEAQADAGTLDHSLIDDVDPVAEADIYLSAGRDLQAEEILKTALAEKPERLAIHVKLAEIYAQRADAANLEAIAEAAHRISGGRGPEWDQISALGREVEPSHPLYQINVDAFASMQPAAQTNEEEDILALMREPMAEPAAQAQAADDFKLDFETDAPAAEAPAAQAQDPLEAMMAEPDFGLEPAVEPELAATATANPEDPGTESTAAENGMAEMSEMAATGEHAPMEFDLSALSLDLASDGSPSLGVDPSAESSGLSPEDEPLAIKLDLAQQFREIGDTEGARALIEEIIAEAQGEMKARAEQALADLG